MGVFNRLRREQCNKRFWSICLADGNGTAELELEPGRPRAVAHTDGGGELNAGNVRKGSASLRLL